MSGGKIAAVTFFILFLVWLLLLTLGNLGIMEGSTQKYVKDRKWDEMKKMLTSLYKADGTKDTTVCKSIRDWWDDNKDDYYKFIDEQEDGDPETLQDWSLGIPVEIKFEDFIDEYFDDVGKENAEFDFIDIANSVALCEDEVDLTKLKTNVVNIIRADPPPGYDPTDDCSNVTTEQNLLPNYVWSYDDDTFVDISTVEDSKINSTGWRNKHKRICTPLAMDEEYIPAKANTTGTGVTPAKIKFTNVTNPIKDMVIKVAEEDTNNDTGLKYTLPSSDIKSFEISLGLMTLNKPLYYIKLDDKETDHIFAGNVGTIAFKQTSAAVEAVTAVAGVDVDGDGLYTADGETEPVTAVTAKPAEYDYTIMQFTPNIVIPAGYEIIVEASKLPVITTVGEVNPHSCPMLSDDPKIVAKIQSTTDASIAKGAVTPLTQEWCYATPHNSTGRVTTEPTTLPTAIKYIPATYKAYIRKTKTSTIATDPENPQYKFATLTRAAVATPPS
jgi:hypothetical protein